MSDWNASIIEEFRANHGVVGGPFEGRTLLLLTTTGAKSGATRVNPLAYLRIDDRHVAVFASKGGAPTHPDWYHNVVAHPDVMVEIGDESFRARATVLTGKRRDDIYAEQSERWPQFAEYQKGNPRIIPVVLLERADEPAVTA